MKRLRFLFILLFMGISAFLFGCTYSSSQLEINDKEVYLQVGETYQIEVESESEKLIKYESENEQIASVDEKGVVKAINNGQTKINITQGSNETSCFVYVGISEPSNIYILSYDSYRA